MLSCKVFFHEILIENFASQATWCNEAGNDELEDYQDGSESHISVKIELFLISEEHKEECQR